VSHAPYARTLSVVTALLVALGLTMALARPAYADGVFIPAAERKDMVHDPVRNRIYITNGDEVLRYDLATETFLPPFSLGGDLNAIDISADGSQLAVADLTYSASANTCWIHVVDLETGESTRAEFTRATGEGGTYAVAFCADDSVLVTSRYLGSGWVPLRRYTPSTGVTLRLANVCQDTMLSPNADRTIIAFAESNISDGRWGRYRVSDGTIISMTGYTFGTSAFNYEIAVNRDATSYAIPTYASGTKLYDSALLYNKSLAVRAVGVAYHPTEDILYAAVSGSRYVNAYDIGSSALIHQYDFDTTFPWHGNTAFEIGRLKVSSAGNLILGTVDGGVRYVREVRVLRGSVCSSALGVPVAGAQVELWSFNSTTSEWSCDTTVTATGAGAWATNIDEEGPFRLRVVDPSDNHQPTWYGGDSAETATDVFPAQYPEPALITMPLVHPGGIGGKITSDDGGVPFRGARVCLSLASGAAVIAETSTGDDGSYAFSGLAPGQYFVLVEDPTGKHASKPAPGTVVVTADSTTSVDVTLNTLPRIAGHAYDATSGLPLAGIDVLVFDADEAWNMNVRPIARATTAADGSYSIFGLANELYVIAFCDTDNVYRDMTWPGSGVPIEQSYAIRATAWTTDVDGWLLRLEDLAFSRVERVAGGDRYETALEVSRNTFPAADVAVIVSGQQFPDALSAAPLAGAYRAPVLLVKPTSLPSGLLDELDRLGVERIIVVGGTSAVSEATVAQLRSNGYADITRIAGSDRYHTSTLVARAVGKKTGQYLSPFICRGDNFADALSAAPFAYMEKRPILLVKPGSAPVEVGRLWSEIWDDCEGVVILVGGKSSISDDVLLDLVDWMPTGPISYFRIAGSDRYETCGEMVNAYGYNFDNFGIASGKNYPDALTGAAGCGYMGGPILLTLPDHLSSPARSVLEANAPYTLYVQCLGGPAALSTAVPQEAGAVLGDEFYDINDLCGALGVAKAGVFGADRSAAAVGRGRNEAPELVNPGVGIDLESLELESIP